MYLIGIDFSLNSPSVCILNHEDGKTNIHKLISFTRDEHDSAWFLKKKKNPYPILDELKEVDLYFLNKPKIPSEYSKRETTKLRSFMQLTDLIYEVIKKEIEYEKTHIAIEGISFGSIGNSLIDISMATALLRSRLIIICDGFYAFSPGTIKKTSGYKGNAKKWELYDGLIESEIDYLAVSEYVDSLRKNKIEWVTMKKNIKKPLDDLNDSIWVSVTLKNELVEKGLLD